MSDQITELNKNIQRAELTEKTVKEIDDFHQSDYFDEPKIKYINPIIEDNTQDTLANISSCVSLICKIVSRGNTEHSELELFSSELHGLSMFQNCIENALEFEGNRSNIHKRSMKNSKVKEAI